MTGVPREVVPYDPFRSSESPNVALLTDLPFINVTSSPYNAVGDGATDDTAAIEAAFDAAAARLNAFQPTGGAYLGTIPAIYFPAGRYKITSALNPPAYCRIVAEAGAIIEQTTVGQKILNFADSYDVMIRGLKFLKGSNQVYLQNENTNYSTFRFIDCEFQLSTDYAIYTLGTGAGYTTGTVDVTNGSPNVTGNGTAWTLSMRGQFFRVGAGAYIKVKSVNVGAQTLVLATNYAGATQAAVAYNISDQHMSAVLTIDGCKFYDPRKVLHNACDMARVKDSWVQISSANFDANTAAFFNLSGALHFDNMFGVPSMGTGGSRLASVRWVDLYRGSFLASNHSRFGGEDSGMAIVYNFCGYDELYPFNSGAKIVITGCTVSAGEAAPAEAETSGVVHILSQYDLGVHPAVPQQVVYQHNYSLTDSGVIIDRTALTGLDSAAYLAGLTSPELKFRFTTTPNQTWSSADVPTSVSKYQDRQVHAMMIGDQDLTPTSIVLHRSVTAVIDLGVIAANVCTATNVTVAGAQVGDMVTVVVPDAVAGAANVSWCAWVSATDTVSIKVCNVATSATVDFASGTFRVDLWRHR